jgi:hypothetical protein
MAGIDKAVLLCRAGRECSTRVHSSSTTSTLLAFLTMASPSTSRDIDVEAQPVDLQPHRATYNLAYYYPQG